MRFTSESPQYTLPIRWYFCAPRALAMDVPTVFNSANWDSAKGYQTPLGEDRLHVRPWVDGAPPPWGPLDKNCDYHTDDLPDYLYAEVTAAAEVEGVAGVFSKGDVIALPKFNSHPNGWGYTWFMDGFPDTPGFGCTLAFGCITTAYYPYPAIFVISYTRAVPDLFFDQMDGRHYLGAANVWYRGTPILSPPLFETLQAGECPACGLSVWKPEFGMDFVSAASGGFYSQPVQLRISGVNPKVPDPWHTFAPWFFPPGFVMPDYF